MAHRHTPVEAPIKIVHDGDTIEARAGEPLAQALVAADRLLIARSAKLHRPRGPYCMRGGCDGCLARVNGVPNVMTCLTPARAGDRIETQNVIGSRGVDLLQASDFLFPRGMDHHRLFAGVRGLSAVMQKFARRVAGLGRLPDEAGELRPAERIERDVLVVGGGAAGLAAAAELGPTLLVDDGLELGGSLGLTHPEQAAELVSQAQRAGAELRPRTTAAALFREPDDGKLRAVLSGPRGASLVVARAVVVASGCHAPVLAFDDNDLPGVISARAALELWRQGVAVAERAALVGDGPCGRAFEELAGAELKLVRIEPAALVSAVGRSRVTGVVVREEGRESKKQVGAIVVDGAGAPSFELAVQAGAAVRFDAQRGFVPQLDGAGLAAPGVWCAGSVTGKDLASREQGARVGRALRASLT